MIGALSLSLFACGKKADDTTDKSSNSTRADVIAEDTSENDNEVKMLTYDDMTKLIFDFSSGVGGWGTGLQFRIGRFG